MNKAFDRTGNRRRSISMALAALGMCWLLLPGCPQADQLRMLAEMREARDGRLSAWQETRDALGAILTEDQEATLAALRESQKAERETRRAHIEAQRALIKSLDLSAPQREALRGVLESWRDDLVASIEDVVSAKAALRDQVLAQPSSEEAITGAAAALGAAIGDAAVIGAAVVEDSRAVLTAEQSAIVEQLVERHSAYADETGGIANRIDTVLGLAEARDLSAEQRDQKQGVVQTRRDTRR